MTLTLATGTATGHLDLLDALNSFLGSLSGWSVTEYPAAGGLPSPYASDRQLTVRIGASGPYLHFQSDLNNSSGLDRFRFCPSTGHTAGGTTRWDSHPGSPAEDQAISVPRSGASFDYWLIGDTTYLWIVALMPGGWFQVAFCGQLALFPGGANGYYFEGMVSTDSNTDVQEYDSEQIETGGRLNYTSPLGLFGSSPSSPSGALLNHGGAWVAANYNAATTAYALTSFARASATSLHLPATNAISAPMFDVFATTLATPLFPVTMFAPHPTLAGLHAPIGRLPGAFFVNTRYVGEEYAGTTKLDIAGVKHYIFPAGKTRRIAHAHRYAGVAIVVPA